MSSSSETGHAKNVANFKQLIEFPIGLGTSYNPSNNVLKITSLQAKHTTSKAAINDVTTTKTAFDNATDDRHDAFSGVKPLGTRIVNAFAICGVSDSIVEGAKAINRKLQGQSASDNTKKETPPTNTAGDDDDEDGISTSQQSYDNIIEHLNALIALISSHPEYMPNEPELKVAALTAYSTTLETANDAVKTAFTAFSNSIKNRNKELYTKDTGLVDIALDVKTYIKSVFGATSPEYKQVSGIEFKKRNG